MIHYNFENLPTYHEHSSKAPPKYPPKIILTLFGRTFLLENQCFSTKIIAKAETVLKKPIFLMKINEKAETVPKKPKSHQHVNFFPNPAQDPL